MNRQDREKWKTRAEAEHAEREAREAVGRTYQVFEKCYRQGTLYGPNELAGDRITITGDEYPGSKWALVRVDGHAPNADDIAAEAQRQADMRDPVWRADRRIARLSGDKSTLPPKPK